MARRRNSSCIKTTEENYTEENYNSCKFREEGAYIVLHNSKKIISSNRMVKGNPKVGDKGIRFATVENAINAVKAGMLYTFMGHKQEKVEFRIMDMDTLEVVKSFTLSFNPKLIEN